VINTIAGSILMFTLYNVTEMGYWLSSALSYVFGATISFFLNKYFTFAVKEWSIFMIFVFIVNTAICYFIAYGVAKPAMGYFLQSNSLRMRENAALFTGMCLYTGLNYLGQRFIVFKNKK
jgi:putative flippase GtrA